MIRIAIVEDHPEVEVSRGVEETEVGDVKGTAHPEEEEEDERNGNQLVPTHSPSTSAHELDSISVQYTSTMTILTMT